MAVMDRDATGVSRLSAGWHVHYEVGGRLRVLLACNRETAIDMARTLLSERLDVLRLVRYDAREIIGATEVRTLCAREPSQSSSAQIPIAADASSG
jgi:hypothetical protein